MQTRTATDSSNCSESLVHPDAKLLSLGRIKCCPFCSYSLRGLPSRHRCPECGFEYDEDTLCYRPSGTWRFIAAFVAFWLFADKVVGIVRAPSGVGSLGWWSDVGLAALWGLPILYYLIDWGERQQLIMRSMDIQWKKRGEVEEKHEWKDIESVEALNHSEMVRLKLANKKNADIPRVFWPKRVKLREFARFVDSYRKRMLASNEQIKEVGPIN